MAALRVLRQDLDGQTQGWYFHYYGSHEEHVRNEAKRFGVNDRVISHGTVPRAKALSAIKGAGLAVVITAVTEENRLSDQGIIPAKLFETIGLGTQILLIAPSDSDAAEILSKARLGMNFCGSDVKGISRYLGQVVSGRMQRNPSPSVTQWEWSELVRPLNVCLRGLLDSRVGGP